MSFKLLLIFVASAAWAAGAAPALPTGLRLLFPAAPARRYVYRVALQVAVGTEPPPGAPAGAPPGAGARGRGASRWRLEGALTVQPCDNYTRARLHLHIQNKTVIDNSEQNHLYSVEGDKFLKNPWELDYQENGFIKSIYVMEEPPWSVNLKRAISVNFQLTRNSAAATYTISEPCLDDICVLVYSWRGAALRKYTSYRVPAARSSYSWGSVPWTAERAPLPAVESISSAERLYELDQKGLINFDLKGSYQYKTHDHILSVTSDMSLRFKEDLPPAAIEKMNLSQTTIQYVAGDFSDPNNGIANNTQMYLTNKSYKTLLKIARKGIDADNIVRNASLIHNLDFIELLNTMSQLKYESLIKLFNDLVLGTSYDMETSRNIFLEILPHVRSDACARVIKYLVLEEKEKIEDAALLSLIRKLPFNIAVPSQKLLEELEVFTKLGLDFPADIRHAGILGYATLAHNTMQAQQVKQDYFDNIVVKYFRMYSDCPQYLDRLVWLQGLCNLGYSGESYTRVVVADAGRDAHERLWAALHGNKDTEEPYMVLDTTLPILTNESAPTPLRIVSAHTFLSSVNIRETDFAFVHNYITSCSNKHLQSFWYSTIKNLAMNRDFSGYRVPSFYIPFVARTAPPGPLLWASSNYIVSGARGAGGAGGAPSLQLLTAGDGLAATPAFIGLKLDTGGQRPYKAAVYVVVEGVVPNIYEYKRRFDVDPRELNSDKLLDILRGFKSWAVKKSEKFHVDIVVKLHDKTVYATHMNQTRFERWNKEDYAYLEDVLLFGSHINQQIVYYPFQTDVHFPTELGTPIRLQSTILSFTSIRGNLTAPSNEDVTWRNDLHIRYQGTAVTSLSTAAPPAGARCSLHAARIQQTLVAHLPVRFNVSLSGADRSLLVTWPNPGDQQAGVAMHARVDLATDTQARGHEHASPAAAAAGLGNKKDSIFFDCEQPLTGTEVLNKLLASNTKYQEFLQPIQPSLIALNAIVLFSAPPAGSCGVILRPRRAAARDALAARVALRRLEGGLATAAVGVDFELKYYSLENPDNVFLNIEAAALLKKTDGNVSFDLKVQGHHPNVSADGTKNWQICFKEEEVTHPSFLKDISSAPAPYEGAMSLVVSTANGTSCGGGGGGGEDSELRVNYKGVPAAAGGKEVRVKIAGKKLENMGVLDLELVSQTEWGQLLRAYQQGPLNISAVIKETADGLATASSAAGARLQLKLGSFAWLLDRWTDVQALTNFGFYRECRLTASSLQTLSGDVLAWPRAQCAQHLLLADCTDNTPRFAVFASAEGGVRVHSGGHHVTLSARGGGGMGGGEQGVVAETHAGDQFTIEHGENITKVTSKISSLLVYHSAEQTVVLVPRLFLRAACGLCADGDAGAGASGDRC